MNFSNAVHTGQYDDKTNAISTISHTLETLHEGQNFNTFISAHGIASGGTVAIGFSVGTCGCDIHFVPHVAASGEGFFDIIEGATWNPSTGTGLKVFNHNRNLTNILPRVLENTTGNFVRNGHIIAHPTGITGGTVIEHYLTSSGHKTGGAAGDLDEWILKQGEKYIIKFTSESADNHVNIRLGWYEHI